MNANIRSMLVLVMSLTPPATWINAKAQDWRAPIQDRLEAKFTPTKASTDKSDIITAGAVLVLKKDNLVMVTTDIPNLVPNVYKDGRITQNLFGRINRLPGMTGNRTFVRGEKFWVDKIDIKDDGVVFEFLSDPFDDVRYKGTLRFPFPKRSPPPPGQIESIVAQVIAVEGADESAANSPPADPATISSGRTKAQVLASFGQPQKIATVGAKQIYYYKDLKVTFVNGKVSEVETAGER